jgi:hypothetical protein
MLEDAFRGLDRFLKLATILLLIFIPLGMWKLVDIIIWLYKNVSITIG